MTLGLQGLLLLGTLAEAHASGGSKVNGGNSMKSIKGLIWVAVVGVLAPAMARGQGTNPVSAAVR